MKLAAIYTRVSSDQQKENQTIESQVSVLKEYASQHDYNVPEEWCFRDEGYSGAYLVRPGLERLRDLAAEGQITTILIYSPDRLSRKYAYQILLMEEFKRKGIEVIFFKSPKATTPEDELLLQFQGMISEYERAQIVERSRRGKKHQAKLGIINSLSNAPYGYRYVKKSEHSNALYEVVEEHAEIVRQIFQAYIQEDRPMLGIAKWLNKRGVGTRSGKGKWLASSIRSILRNPAYKGEAAFGRRSHTMDSQGVTRRRWRGKFARGMVCRERPKEEWITIAVPAIITVDVFDLAQERLKKNEHFSERNTKYHTLLQGFLVCGLCGYAVYRVSGPTTNAKGKKLHYYRCSCSERWRMGVNRVCPNRPIRQDYLDDLVWSQVVGLLENPEVIRGEIDRRVQKAQQSNPMQVRKESLVKEQIRIRSGMDRLLDAYQEGLLPLTDLRQRIPDLKKREAVLSTELESLEMNFIDDQQRLQLTENLEELMKRLHQSVNSLSITERQKVLRLIVKEIIVSPEGITIKHSIPVAQKGKNDSNYQLQTDRQRDHSSGLQHERNEHFRQRF